MYGFIQKHKKIAVLIIAIASLSFLFWMFSAADIRDIAGGSKACIATVNGECVTLREFRIEALRSPVPIQTREDRIRLAETLVVRELLYQKAKRIGLYTSDREVAEVIKEDPAFKENGNFSVRKYKELLASLNILPEEYEAYLRKILTVNKLIDLIGNGVYITSEEKELYKRLNYTKIDGEAYIIDRSQVRAVFSPSEEEIRKFYEENKEMFVEEESRSIKLWETKDKEKAVSIYEEVKMGREPEGFHLIREDEIEKLPEKIRKRLERKDYTYDLRKIGDTYYIVKVIREEGKRIKPLEEVREKIIEELIAEREEELMEQRAKEIKNKLLKGIKVGTPSLKLRDTPVNQIRLLFGVDTIDLIHIFDSSTGVIGPLKTLDGYLILKVNNKQFKEPPQTDLEKLEGELFVIKRSALLDFLIKSMQKKADIEFNMEFLR